MPHKAYGINWPIYQEPKTKLGRQAPTNNLPTPQRALTETTLFWPPEALPFAYALACVDIVLLRSPEAEAAYHRAIKVLELPGNQALLRDAISEHENTQKDIGNFIRAIEKGSALPQMNIKHQYESDPDYKHYIERVLEFIRVGFNRQEDQDNERHKVIAEKTRFLFSVVVIRTIVEYCKVKLENWNKYRPDAIDRVMTGPDPTKRRERNYIRLKRKEIRQIYKCYKWVRLHNVKLLEIADHWYQSRVVFSGPEEYCREHYKKTGIWLDSGNVDGEIATIDHATGYPRKWRK